MSALTNDILVGQNNQEPGLPSAVRMFTINHFTSINKTSSSEFRKLNQYLKINATRPLRRCYRRLSRLMKPNLVKKILPELPKSPTRNIIANYEKCRTLHEYNRNLRSITRCDKSIARILDNPKTSPPS